MKINYFNADHTHALIDLPTKYSIEEVIKLFEGGILILDQSQSTYQKAGLPGVSGTGHSQFHIPMLHVSLNISLIKKSIIAGGHIQTSTRCLLSGMVWNGALKKTIKMVFLSCVSRLAPG